MPDPQITELSGRHYLIAQLLAGGVEVAEPVRDRGIDLIAYVDTGSDFVSCPIQLKASEESRFVVMRKYEHITNILLVYAWNMVSSAPDLYALTYREGVALLDSRGHTKTESWTVDGWYHLKVNSTWREMLAPYRMQPKDWAPKILGMSKTLSSTADLKE